MNAWVAFVIGVIFGGFTGVLTMALCVIAGRES